MDKEIWKSVVGFEYTHEVSNKGRVRKIDTGRIITFNDNGGGYLSFPCYTAEGKLKQVYIHRAVAMAFLDNLNNYRYVGHKDHNKENNCVENLYWTSASTNTKDGIRDGKINYEGRYVNGFYKRSLHKISEIYCEAIISGEITKTAEKYGVSRTTVSSWINKRSHVEFTDLLDLEMATLSKDRKQLWLETH